MNKMELDINIVKIINRPVSTIIGPISLMILLIITDDTSIINQTDKL